MRPRIYITHHPIAPGAVERLRNMCEVEINTDPLHIPSEQELIPAVKRCDILFCLLHDRVTADMVRANPRPEAIVSTTITPANIAVDVATERRIPVDNVAAGVAGRRPPNCWNAGIYAGQGNA